MTVIYVDILILINFALNLLLIRVTAFFCRKAFPAWRASLAAFFGALSSLVILLPPYGIFAMFTYKTIFCGLMIFLTFGYINIRNYLKEVFVLFLASLIFGGGVLFLSLSFNPKNMVVYNGAFYMNISAVFLIFSAAFCYILTSLFERLLRGKKLEEDTCRITVIHKNTVKSFNALIDTGNSLTEPFSHLPVIVLSKNSFSNEIEPQNAVANSFRMIPFAGVGGAGALPAFMPDRVDIFMKSEKIGINRGCYVAISGEKIGNGEYEAIVNPALLA